MSRPTTCWINKSDIIEANSSDTEPADTVRTTTYSPPSDTEPADTVADEGTIAGVAANSAWIPLAAASPTIP